MSPRYASRTEVPVMKSVAELERLVAKHGATGFGYGTDDADAAAQVVFRIADRMVRFRIGRPSPDEFARTPTGLSRSAGAARLLADQEERRRWRALVLIVKALLVAVADGVITLSDAFLPYTLLPSGSTVGEWAGPQLDVISATARMPSPLPGAGAKPRAIES